MRKLKKLKQTSLAAKYASQFREILAHVPMQEDHIRIVMFKNGLKFNVKALFVTIDPPTTFDAFVTQAIGVDNRLHSVHEELKDEGKSSSNALPFMPNTHTSTPVTSTPFYSAVVPMEVDAVKHGPLTDAEHKHRRDNNLCAYCGGPHKDCPILAAKNAKTGSSKQGKASPGAQ
ncbi:hypothetical protein OBBRIDRAFT_857784 [Obba rivulosa]|uniref:Retrotransposon gag domain-containing protein n=1 Tax=Obba rivulosa TaxID=1052685 RepID=A0A8E2DFB7_9APHY|nr:hypothetical protein OBBRIDRAFT_857784 [Obba rivulosa]